jgi:hypothetical protein
MHPHEVRSPERSDHCFALATSSPYQLHPPALAKTSGDILGHASFILNSKCSHVRMESAEILLRALQIGPDPTSFQECFRTLREAEEREDGFT